MERLAEIYAGRPFIIDVADIAPAGGEAWNKSGVARITIDCRESGQHLAYVFCHELAHHVLNHVRNNDTPPRSTDIDENHMTLAAAGVKADSTGNYFERRKAYLDRLEREADAWAKKTLGELRQRFPDIDKLLCG